MVLVIDNYDSFTYNLVQYFGELGAQIEVRRNDEVTVDEIEKELKPERIVISPGPGTPDEAGVSLDVIGNFAGHVPLLGVCLGHQAIGQAYGGQVVRAPVPMHGKLSIIRHRNKGLFKDVPRSFAVTRYHSLIVERASLPADLAITAETDDGLIMGLTHESHPVHGVQFHPESIASEHGHELLANFLILAGLSPRRRNAPRGRAA